MERYRLILRHEYVGDSIEDIEEPIECSVDINNLDDSMSFNRYMLYNMCDSIINFIELENEGKIND